MTTPKRARARTESAHELYRAEVAAYVAAGGDESVQRVITGVHGLARRLNQWYDRQLADLDLSHGEWAVLSRPRDGARGSGDDAEPAGRRHQRRGVLDDPPPGPDEPARASSPGPPTPTTGPASSSR